MTEEKDDWDFEPTKPYWFCEECGFKDEKKAMPKDKNAFYKKVNNVNAPKCPQCNSHSLMPKGW